MALECAECRATFTAAQKSGARPRYCSDACRSTANRARAARNYAARKGPEQAARMAANSRRAYERRAADPAAIARQREMTTTWRAAHPDHLASYGAEYRQANAARVTEKNRRRRARLLDAWIEDVNLGTLLERSGGCCGICAEPIDLSLTWPHKMSVTVDHIKPLSRGGVHSYGNTQPAHAVCNSRKNDRDVAA